MLGKCYSWELDFKNADGLVGEAIMAHVSQHVSSVNKENSCECCIHLSMELSEVKLELSSCKEIIRILQE